MVDSKFGPKIRALRRRHGLRQVDLAQRLGISASYLNLIDEVQSWEPTRALFDLEGYRICDDQMHCGGPDPIIIQPM